MPLEGLQLGRYRLLSVLGGGGMGEVYLAEDTLIHRQVAVKVIRAEADLHPDSEAANEAARLFQREMRAISMLDHPRILPLFDYGEEQINEKALAYMVMPFREEGSLATWLRKRSSTILLPPQDIVHIVQQAAEALQYSHDRQIIHQDVKPANFLIRSNRESPDRPDLMLADFGVAKFTTATSSASQSVRGTPTYMAPEQWEGHPVPATDQYALAIMTYELLTNRLPFQGGLGQMMFQHFQVQPQPPSDLNPRLAKDIDTVILHALAKKPQERFASISAFARAFQQALHYEPAASTTLPPSPSPTSLPPGPTYNPAQPVIPSSASSSPAQAVPPFASPQSTPSGLDPSQPIAPPASEPSRFTPASFTPPQPALAPSESSQSAIPTFIPQQPQRTPPSFVPPPTPGSGLVSSPIIGLRSNSTSGQTITGGRNLSRGTAVLLIGLVLLIVAGSILYFARAITTSGNSSSHGGSSPTAPGAPLSQQVFTLGLEGGITDLPSFDPALAPDTFSASAIDMVFTGLVQLDDKLNVKGQLASSWDISADHMTYTFHLRPNLVFSDGTPLTSADVAYSINRALLPATLSPIASYYLHYIQDSDKLSSGAISTLIGDSIMTPDAETVSIRTNKAVSFFLDELTYPSSFVVEKSLIDKYGKSWTDHLSEGGGDGPFTVQSYVHSKQIVFVPNPRYYGPKPQLQKVIFPFYASADIAYSAYQANQVDETGVPLAHYLTDQHRSDFHKIPQLSISYYTMNYLQKPFDKTKIRQAFALAINKDVINQAVWKGSSIATNHIVPQGMSGYDPNLTGPAGVKGTAGDLNLAKLLMQQGMQEEGYTSIAQLPPITLTYSSTGVQAARDEVAAMQQMWQSVLGVTVKTNDIDFTKLISDESMGANNPLQFYAGPAWIADYPDPEDWTTLQFDKGATQNGMSFGQNHGPDAAAQQTLQTLMEQADVMGDPNARLQAYTTIEQQLVNYVAWMPMEQQATNILLKPYVQGFVLNGENLIPPDDWGNIYIAAH